MKHYDTNNDGTICYNEFMNGLKQDLNERRSNIVNRAFASLEEGGVVSTDRVRQVFNVAKNPDFLERGHSR
jgi:Ca2+-binding EF-hand superfamily protein